MSKLSVFLKKTFGIKEYDLERLPFVTMLKNEILNYGGVQVFKDVSDNDLQFLKTFIQSEIYRRQIKNKQFINANYVVTTGNGAGIGKADEPYDQLDY